MNKNTEKKKKKKEEKMNKNTKRKEIKGRKMRMIMILIIKQYNICKGPSWRETPLPTYAHISGLPNAPFAVAGPSFYLKRRSGGGALEF
jgi:hypothetical protein